MTDISNDGQVPGAGAEPNLGVLAQYLKDLSFENPGAPQSLMARNAPPNINVGINVRYKSLPGPQTDLEVELALECRATTGETTLFVAEVVYAGVFRLTNIPEENVQPLAMIECPRLLFPFARQILADACHNGGFPVAPLDPIDFFALYRQRMEQDQQAGPSPTMQA